MPRKINIVIFIATLLVGLVCGYDVVCFGKAIFENQKKRIACEFIESHAHEVPQCVVALRKLCWENQ